MPRLDHEQPTEPVEVATALRVVDVRALAALDHDEVVVSAVRELAEVQPQVVADAGRRCHQGSLQAHIIRLMPPSTRSTWPVTYPLRTRASTASAQSSGVAERCSGEMAPTAACRSSQSAVHGVATRPGATALTRTGPHDLASSNVSWFSAAFVIEYAMDEPVGRTPATDVTITTFGSSAARRWGIAALVSHHVPNTLTSKVRRKMSSVSASRSS